MLTCCDSPERVDQLEEGLLVGGCVEEGAALADHFGHGALELGTLLGQFEDFLVEEGPLPGLIRLNTLWTAGVDIGMGRAMKTIRIQGNGSYRSQKRHKAGKGIKRQYGRGPYKSVK